jgi:hypothetical protein
MSAHEPEQQRQFGAELQQDSALCGRVLETLPPVEVEPKRIIRCSPENIERAICRAFARCREWGEFWKIEVVER